MFNKLINLLKPYRVVTYWGKPVTHYAWTRRDALEWLACYPSAVVYKYTHPYQLDRNVEFIASRNYTRA